MWFKKGPEKERLSTLQAAKKLEDLFLETDPKGEIKKMKSEFAVLGTDTEVHLCFITLFLIALRDVLRKGEPSIKPAIANGIFRLLEESFLKEQHPFGLLSMDPDAVEKRFDEVSRRLLDLWEKGKGEAPGSDWAVGKEICYFLNGREKEPPPGLVFTFSSLVTSYANAIRSLLKKLAESHLLVH